MTEEKKPEAETKGGYYVEGSPPTGEVTFRDRVLKVKLPMPEQVMMWQRVLSKLERANKAEWSGREVVAALEQTRQILDSLLSQEDVEWLDGEMLAGRVGMKEASQIMLDATELMKGLTGNRAERRAAAKKAPARRKKATP